MRLRSPLVIGVAALLLAACGGARDAGAPGTPTDAATSPATETGPPGEGASRYTGTFGGDAQLEGGCAWLELTGGTPARRVEPVWPDGYEVEFDPLLLRGPKGEVAAEEGDELTVRGELREDVATICQIGPVLEIVEVLAEG